MIEKVVDSTLNGSFFFTDKRKCQRRDDYNLRNSNRNEMRGSVLRQEIKSGLLDKGIRVKRCLSLDQLLVT